MSTYPTQIDTFSPGGVGERMDGTDAAAHAHVGEHAKLADAVRKIELELGTDPSASFSDVAARFAALPGGGNSQPLVHASAKAWDSTARNMAIGTSLPSRTTGTDNVLYGNNAGLAITTGIGHVAIGADAAKAVTNGTGLVAIGQRALDSLTSAGSDGHIAIGTDALGSLTTTGSYPNIAIGPQAMAAVSTAAGNIAIGWLAMNQLTTDLNTVVGLEAMKGAAADTNNYGANTAIGEEALKNSSGGRNTAVGAVAGAGTGGSHNVQIGFNCASITGAGHRNVHIGAFQGGGIVPNVVNALDQVTVGYGAGPSGSVDVAYNGAVTIGSGARHGAANTVAVGYQSQSLHTASVALGSNSVTTKANQVMIGARSLEITDATQGIVLKSPDGSRWLVKVANGGTLTVGAAP